MSDRSKNIMAAVAVFGIAAIASSQGLMAKTAPTQVAAVAQLTPVSLNH